MLREPHVILMEQDARLTSITQSMSNIDKTFVIQWYGPFGFNSENNYTDLRTWEEKYPDEKGFCIYYIDGKPPQKKNRRSYIGITLNKHGVVSKRYSTDITHKIHQLKEKQVWIGRFANKKRHSREDAELCESLLIAHLLPELNTKKKKFYPEGNISLINRWYNHMLEPRIQRKYFMQQNVPALLISDDDGIWTSDKLTKQLEWE